MILKELELMTTEDSLKIYEKGNGPFICEVWFVDDEEIDSRRAAYAKSFVDNHNKSCTDGGGN